MIWALEALLIGAAIAFRRPAVLRYLAVLSVVLLFHTPVMALYNLVALAGIALSLSKGTAIARLKSGVREQLFLALLGLLLGLALSTFLARGAIPGSVFASSMRGLVGIAAAGSLALFAFLDCAAESRRSWALAFSAAVLVLCCIRLVSDGGLDLYPWLRTVLDAEPPGQPRDFGSRNTLGGILNASLPVILLVGRAGESRLATLLRYLAAAISVYTLVSLQSRTGTLVFVVGIAVLFLLLLRRDRRALRPIGFAAASFVLALGMRTRVEPRPLVVKRAPAPPSESLGSIQVAAAPGGLPALRPAPRAGASGKRPAGVSAPLFSVKSSELAGYLFRVPLTSNYHAFRQRFFVSRAEKHFQIHGRATSRCRGRLRILVDGRPHLLMVGRGQFPENFGWKSFPLPAGLEAGKWHTIALIAEGDLSPVDSYYEISALRYASAVVSSEFVVHGQVIRGDISSDPGTQEGIGVILLGDGRTLPAGRWLPPGAGSSRLDQSLRDRAQLWRIAWDHWMERPLCGWGFYTFGYYFPIMSRDRGFFDDYANAHSLYFDLLHDGGLVSILFIALVIAAAGLALRKRASNGLPTETLALAVTLGGFFVNSLTQMTLVDQRYYALMSILLGLFLARGAHSRAAEDV